MRPGASSAVAAHVGKGDEKVLGRGPQRLGPLAQDARSVPGRHQRQAGGPPQHLGHARKGNQERQPRLGRRPRRQRSMAQVQGIKLAQSHPRRRRTRAGPGQRAAPVGGCWAIWTCILGLGLDRNKASRLRKLWDGMGWASVRGPAVMCGQLMAASSTSTAPVHSPQGPRLAPGESPVQPWLCAVDCCRKNARAAVHDLRKCLQSTGFLAMARYLRRALLGPCICAHSGFRSWPMDWSSRHRCHPLRHALCTIAA